MDPDKIPDDDFHLCIDGEDMVVPWTLRNYMNASGMKWPSRMRLYCVSMAASYGKYTLYISVYTIIFVQMMKEPVKVIVYAIVLSHYTNITTVYFEKVKCKKQVPSLKYKSHYMIQTLHPLHFLVNDKYERSLSNTLHIRSRS